MTELIDHAREHVELPLSFDSSQLHFTYILSGSRIISWGHNKGNKTHPLAKKYGNRYSCIHSELDALLKHRDTLRRCKVVNVRIKKDGSPGLSKPCPCCQKLLKDHGIKSVYYTTENGFEVLELT